MATAPVSSRLPFSDYMFTCWPPNNLFVERGSRPLMEEGDRGRSTVLVSALLIVSAMGLAGCVDSQTVAEAAAEAADCQDASGVQNDPGRFEYGGAVSCKTGTESFNWENPSPYADVQFGSGVAAGELSIEITDAADRTVYQNSAAAGGEGRQERTEMGVPSGPWGSWTIEITFENVTGALGVQVYASE